MIPSLNFCSSTLSLSFASHKQAQPQITATQQRQPLVSDVFFSGLSRKANKYTVELFDTVKDPDHGHNPEELHDEVLRLLSQGANPHHRDKEGKTAAEHLEKLKLYSTEQLERSYRAYHEVLACGYSFAFVISDYASAPEMKPLPKTLEILREWAVNEGAAFHNGAALGFSEDEPLLGKPKANYSFFGR